MKSPTSDSQFRNHSFLRFCRTFHLFHFGAILIGGMALYFLLLQAKRAIVMSDLERMTVSCETRIGSLREVLSIVHHESSCNGFFICFDTSIISDQTLDKSMRMELNKGCPLRYVLEDACDDACVKMSFSLFSRTITLLESLNQIKHLYQPSITIPQNEWRPTVFPVAP